MRVNLGQTTTPGTTLPTLYEQCVGSLTYLTSHRIYYVCRACETGPTVYRPYPRRLESLGFCRCYYKGSTFFSVITGAHPVKLTRWRLVYNVFLFPVLGPTHKSNFLLLNVCQWFVPRILAG